MQGPGLVKMAWRNLWRNRRRTLITLASVAFGVMLAVLFTGMGDYSYRSMIDLAARMGGGHVSIQHPEYQETPTLEKTVTGADDLGSLAMQHSEVTHVVPRIAGATMLATATDSYGAFFLAIDPAQESAETLTLLDDLVEGEMFTSADQNGIVLGATLAENLGVEIGRKVVYTMTDKHGEIVSGLVRVSGVVDMGSPTMDGGLAVLPIGTIRQALGYGPDEVTQVAVFVDDERDSQTVADGLNAAVPDGAEALTWRETQPDLAGFIAIDSAGMVVFEVIIMVLIAAGIFNSLFVSVMERLREFGIMMAVGFSTLQLFGLIMWESLWLGLIGLVAAAVVTVGPYWYLHDEGFDYSSFIGEGAEISGVVLEPVLYADIYPEKVLVIAGVVLLTTLVSGLYPAWKAGRVAPVETIKLV